MTSGEYGVSRRDVLKAGTGLVLGSASDRLLGAMPVPADKGAPLHQLMTADMSRSLDLRNLSKMVRARKVLDDMEVEGQWQATSAVQLTYSSERARSGTRSLRATILLRDDDLIQKGRQANGTFDGNAILFEVQPGAAVLTRTFDPPQDWSAFNRLSLWCYVHPGNPINALALEFLCDGASAGPNDPVAIHYIGDLKPGEWNQLTWEIPEYRRDRISSFVIFQPRWGLPVAGSGPAATYDFDELELQLVDAEPVEGWAVTPGQIAYSHVGYRTDGPKIALVAASTEDNFELLDVGGNRVAGFVAEAVSNRRGQWRRLDFGKFNRPGTYRLRYGNAKSEPFPIVATPWRPVAEAILNTYFGMRCGCAVPGVHDACHLDVFIDHEGRQLCLAGGWHDAANLTQNANNTHLCIYSLISLMEAAQSVGDTALAGRAAEEARWGLSWSLRLRLSPGVRAASVPASFYTDSKLGTDDDVKCDRARVVRDDPFTNVLAVLAYARAARAFRNRDPGLTKALTEAALADFKATLPTIAVDGAVPSDMNQGSTADQLGYATLASVELFRMAQESEFRDAAVRLGRGVLDTQERGFLSGIPVAGYFYEDTHRVNITHEFHSSFEEGRLLALEALCETFPTHPDWMEWYGGLLTYSEYFCAKGTEASSPFDVIPAAVWRRQDIEVTPPENRMAKMMQSRPSPIFPTAPSPELVRQHMREQYEAGSKLGEDHRLRVFPLWFDHVRHGASVVHLTKAIGLAAAAMTRGHRAHFDLAERQMQWTLGCNPFSRSLMYGVGKDWWQNFTVEVPNLVGGLSVGMNSYSNDSPAWGNNSVYPYKEIWVLAASRAALLTSRLMAPQHSMDSKFEARATARDGVVELLIAGNEQAQSVELRCLNLDGGPLQLRIPSAGLRVKFRITDATRPWIMVLLPDGKMRDRRELFGTAQSLAPIV